MSVDHLYVSGWRKIKIHLSVIQNVNCWKKLDRSVKYEISPEECGIAMTTMYDIKKQKDELLKYYAKMLNKMPHKLKTGNLMLSI